MQIKNTFVEGKLNKDLDERLLPVGQYPDALNICVANTDASDMGAIESSRGNKKLTSLGYTHAKTIGAYADSSNQKLYWWVTSDEKDLVVEYKADTKVLTILLEATAGTGVLNFSRDFLITGVAKIINGDSSKDLLVWVDDRNGVRVINIERAKTYLVDGFEEDDISLIKKPPRYAPTINLAYSTSTLENTVKNKFMSFAYRYKYLDGDYSALSSFTNYAFAPNAFSLDYQTMENEGMVNSFNAVQIEFETGSKRVTDIELVFKESRSNIVYVIESFNKANEGWIDDEPRSFTFVNNKILKVLPEDEIYRSFDNVPRKAKALEVIGNRLVFGNYVEQYDLKDVLGEDIKMDYSLELLSNTLLGVTLETTYLPSSIPDDVIVVNFDTNLLTKGTRINFDFYLDEKTYSSGSYEHSFDFILSKDFADVATLAADVDFRYFIEEVLTGNFNDQYIAVPPANSSITSRTGFSILTQNVTTLFLLAPTITYLIDDTPANTTDNPTNTHSEVSYWAFRDSSGAYLKGAAVDSSIKTNRSYEVGVLYLDKYNRETTTLTSATNTLYVPQEFSTSQNKLLVHLKNKPPVFADRFKFVVKQTKGDYHTIYTNIFYTEGLYRWVKLEGANKDKVKEGDTLIVKSDLGGVRTDIVKVRVLEVAIKESDFIKDNVDSADNPIIEEAGLYMKIKPTNVDMNFEAGSVKTFEGGSHLRYANYNRTNPHFGDYVSGVFTPYQVIAGSRIHIYIKFKARGDIAYEATYDKRFTANGDYLTVRDWFNAEVVDLGSFGRDYTWDGVDSLHHADDLPFGMGDVNNRGSGWDFAPDGKDFWVIPHRDGTASRSITTTVKFEVAFSEGTVIFETDPVDSNAEIFYQTAQTFDIVDGFHIGNIQSQSALEDTATMELDFFNCYVQGNGAESYRYKDAFNVGTDEAGVTIKANALGIDLRPTSTAVETYRELRRFADLTYSEPYNENTNYNGLNVFNLVKANYKEDIDKKFGYIQKLFSRDTDLVVFQEDKVSRVLFGKDLLMNADGTANLSSIQDILGQQVAYTGEYGISRNAESFSFDANNLYFTDSKRGCVCRLGAQGITEISLAGLRTWFKDSFRDSLDGYKLGAYDPYLDQYVLHNEKDISTLTFDEKVKGWTSFHSYFPEYMIGMNNDFYTFFNGELYVHHSDEVLRNEYYGRVYPSRVSLMANQSPSDIKEVQSVSLEGNSPWNVTLSAYLSNVDDSIISTIRKSEFVKKEGLWYAYARRNESDQSFDSKSSYGIGEVVGVAANKITVRGFSTSLTTNDLLMKGSDLSVIGSVQEILRQGVETVITTTITGSVSVGDFILGKKESRIEGGNLRGYTIRVDLDITKDTKAELFAVNLEVKKSSPF